MPSELTPMIIAGDWYDAMKHWMDSVQTWASELCSILEPYVGPPHIPPDNRIMQLATRVFGTSDVTTMTDVYSTPLLTIFMLHAVHANFAIG